MIRSLRFLLKNPRRWHAVGRLLFFKTWEDVYGRHHMRRGRANLRLVASGADHFERARELA